MKANDKVRYNGEEFTVKAINGEDAYIVSGKRGYNVPMTMLLPVPKQQKVETADITPKAENKTEPKPNKKKK